MLGYGTVPGVTREDGPVPEKEDRIDMGVVVRRIPVPLLPAIPEVTELPLGPAWVLELEKGYGAAADDTGPVAVGAIEPVRVIPVPDAKELKPVGPMDDVEFHVGYGTELYSELVPGIEVLTPVPLGPLADD